MARHMTRLLLVVAGSLSLGACVDEDVVYDNRPVFGGVIEAADGFVGYADPSDDDKLTVCGACHSDYQAQWERTGHAFAWGGLQQSGHVQAFCEACHTVNSFGNIVMEEDPGMAQGGHAAEIEHGGRYLDVQCESCHGPGLDHVLSPGPGNIPLAPIQVGTDLSFGCGECHQGAHHPFVEEWERSPHAQVELAPATRAPECSSCHTGEGALLRLGVTADYLNKDVLLGSDAVNAQITCAVCHDPHSAQHEGQLRVPLGGVPVEQTLCAQCHDRQPRPDTRRQQEWLGPHSPETGMLVGNAGWFPPNASIAPGEVMGPHGGDSNPRMCGSCHVVEYGVHDELTDMEFHTAGHGFRAAPCIGPNGIPSGAEDCALTVEARSFRGCVECHGSEEEAAAQLREVATEVAALTRQLRDALLALDPNLSGAGGEIDANDGRFTVAEGALFNMSLAVHPDGFPADAEGLRRAVAGSTTHNPPLMRTLLVESLEALQAQYGAVSARADATAADRSSPADPTVR